jgi:gliding motility-associated-like protein
LAAGVYVGTITDANGAVITKTVAITQASALTATTSQTNVSCNAGVNGSASVIVSGGNSPYTYSWSPSGGLAATVNNLAVGTYTSTITDVNGCTLTKTVTITEPTALIATTTQTNVSCNGGTTGAASVSVSGGTSGYTYLWSPSGGTADTASNLVAGSYTCTITDANGCNLSKTFTITEPTLLTATTSQTNVGCNGASTGAASVTVSGGTTGYAYSWSPSGGTLATASNLVAGSYTCTITDANGCILTKSFTITQPSALTATTSQTNVAVFGSTTGTASVVVSGGVLSYTYAWSPSGGTGATASNLSAGAYTCTITDANGCILTKSFTITQASSLLATTSQTNILCNGAATGAASVSVSGGSLTYTYLWSPSGGTLASASNLVAGVYTCSITDTNGAILVKTFTITQPTLLTASVSQTNVAINGGTTGVATVTVTGGTSSYTYAWLPSGGTGATASNLAAGTYTCSIVDANGCSITKTFTITEPTALVATTSQTNVLCNGATTGAASVNVSGGISPYSYSWSPTVGTGASLNGLAAGTYVCTVTDANGASVVKTFIITEPTALTATTSQTNVTCNAGTNATASVVVSGGTSAYTYLWSPTGGTAATASGLTAGAYTCTVTDANGCSIQKAFTVTQPTALTATTTQTNVAINGASTGAASVVVSGGTASYTYAWSPSGGTGATATNLVSGTYTCTITDANGCIVTKTFTITEPTALTATTSQVNVVCNGFATGSATVSVSGAVSPYTYSWSPSGGTGATASNLAAGVYVGTITDANGAVITKTVTITQGAVIPLPIANAGPASDSICSGSTFTAAGTASNGTVLWTTSGSGTFNNASLANAVYTPSAADSSTGSVVLTMTVTAPGACNIPTASDSLALTIFPTSNAGIIAGAATVCQGTNSTALTLSEYTGTIQWQVSTDNIVFNNIALATSPVITATNLVATTYYRVVVTSGVCSSATTATATIAVNTTSVAGTISGATPVCYGTNSTTLTLSGNLGNTQWQSSTDNSTFTAISSATSNVYTASNLTITTYYRAVSTSGVCSAATTATTVIVNPLPISNAGPASATICAGTTYTTSGIATNGTSSWSTSGTGTFANASNAVTIYTPSSADQINGSVVLTMTVTGNTNGCTSNTTSDAIVLAINSPSAPVAVANQNYCYLINPTVANLTVTSGTNVNWYSAATGGTALNTTSPLATATTYYATQTVSGCESITRTAVLVTLTCSINAVVDTFNSINGYTGGTTASVLNNDLMDGTLLDSSNVILSGISVPTGFTFNSNGTITVPPSTPAGNYLVTYSICEVLNPLNCSQAVATVVVAPAVIDAVIDNYGPMNGFQGSTTTAVLENDLLNGVLVSQSEITLTVVSIPTGLVMNPNGTITVLPGTAPGIYVVNYLISENLNPTNTDQVSAIVTVVDCLTFPSNDCDGDGVTNAQELLDGTNPSDSCSMNFAHQTVATTAIWNNLDCDGDGVINSREVLDGTNPTDLCSFVLTNQTLSTNANWNNSDCDGDGVRNGQEILDGTNPSLPCSFNPIHIASVTSTAWNNSDCDGDGVTNGQEMLDGTNPVDLCSLIPTHITATTSTVWNNTDCDGDGVTNGQEILDGTNPTNSCSLNLANQTTTTNVAWKNSDCDGDGVTNGREILDGTNPLDLCSLNPAHQTAITSTIWNNSDCDGDGVSNNQETVDRTYLLDPCSLTVAHQTLSPNTAWLTSDCDGDGVANGQEIIDGTDVNVACDSNPNHVTLELSQSFLDGDCDNDGLLNGEEIGANPSNPNDFDNNNIPDYLELNNHVTSEDDLEIYNVVTPNGNGDNDVFVIRNIQLYPNNTVTIFNRWGIIVYDVDSYGQDNKFFKGLSEGRSTMRKLEELPIGTYFYSIRYVNSQGVQKERSGYLYLNK